MADRQERKGQRFKKIYVRKITQHEEKFFQLSITRVIRFDLNMEHDEVYGKFVLTVCICSILYFCKKFADCKKIDSAILISQEVPGGPKKRYSGLSLNNFKAVEAITLK